MFFRQNRRNPLTSTKRNSRSRGRRAQLSYDALETRKLLAQFSWTLGVDGDFENAAGWTGPNNIHVVPGANDDASIPGNLIVTANASHTVNKVVGSHPAPPGNC